MRLNRLKFFSFTILVIMMLTVRVNAVVFDCEYPNYDLTVTYDTEEEYKKNINPYVDARKFTSNDEVTNILGLVKFGKCTNPSDALNIDQNLYKEVLNNYGCPDAMYACTYEFWGAENKNILMRIIDAFTDGNPECGGDASVAFTSELMLLTVDDYKGSRYEKAIDGEVIQGEFEDCDGFFDCIWAGVKEVTGFGGEWGYAESSCAYLKYDGPYIGVNVNCGILSQQLLKYIQAVDKYKECGDNNSCRANRIGNINAVEDGIKSQCSALLQSLDYREGEEECIEACLHIRETLNDYKKGTDLYDDLSYKGNCGFSGRLIAWILNILKWIKYILPVLVIVLGIIDFIKAIASSKDDEMKKAQDKFIKRLIAAALTFIVPLIITFILEKMGFDANACGLW